MQQFPLNQISKKTGLAKNNVTANIKNRMKKLKQATNNICNQVKKVNIETEIFEKVDVNTYRRLIQA